MYKEYDPGREMEAFKQHFGRQAIRTYRRENPALSRKEIHNILTGFFTGIFPHLREDDYETLGLLIPANLQAANEMKRKGISLSEA